MREGEGGRGRVREGGYKRYRVNKDSITYLLT